MDPCLSWSIFIISILYASGCNYNAYKWQDEKRDKSTILLLLYYILRLDFINQDKNGITYSFGIKKFYKVKME